MKIDLKNIPGQFLEHLHYGKRIAPRRDWFVLLSISAVLFLASALYNAWVYTQVQNGSSISGAPVSAPGPVFDSNALNKVRDVFTARAAEQSKFVSGAYTFVDPSQ